MTSILNKSSCKYKRIYIHIPFCATKCAYCTFHSLPKPNESLIDLYLEKLAKDFRKEKEKVTKLDSIFIGGGTPSYLSIEKLKKLFGLIQNNFSFENNAEISIECNPESLTKEKAKIITNFANRISLGIQSFSNKYIKTLNRIGNTKTIDNAIELLIAAGAKNLSCDIIYGIPGQNINAFKKDIQKIVESKIFTHFSAYSLTFEESSAITKFYTKEQQLTFETHSANMWNSIPIFLKGSAFKRYEISNYCIPGYECKHNYDIWFGGKYLGFGPTASSFDGKNRWTQKELIKWLDGASPIYDKISKNNRLKEILIMGFRCNCGWKIMHNKKDNSFQLMGHYPANVFPLSNLFYKKILMQLNDLEDQKLLKITQDNGNYKIIPTLKGLLFWNEIGLFLI